MVKNKKMTFLNTVKFIDNQNYSKVYTLEFITNKKYNTNGVYKILDKVFAEMLKEKCRSRNTATCKLISDYRSNKGLNPVLFMSSNISSKVRKVAKRFGVTFIDASDITFLRNGVLGNEECFFPKKSGMVKLDRVMRDLSLGKLGFRCNKHGRLFKVEKDKYVGYCNNCQNK